MIIAMSTTLYKNSSTCRKNNGVLYDADGSNLQLIAPPELLSKMSRHCSGTRIVRTRKQENKSRDTNHANAD